MYTFSSDCNDKSLSSNSVHLLNSSWITFLFQNIFSKQD